VIDPTIEDPHQEIKEKVDFWYTKLESQLTRFNTMSNFWRLIKPARSQDLSGFANPQVTETTRATEAIATFIYRALTSASPNFQFLSNNPNVSQEDLWTSEQVVAWQMTATNYRRKLLKACRSVALFGTVAVEEPWTVCMPYYESTDFQPRSLLQTAFDPLCFDMSLSPWHAVIDYVTEDQLRALGKKMPDVWDQSRIEEAIGASSEMKNLSSSVQARLAAAGYTTYGGASSYPSHIYQLTTYYGDLKGGEGEYCSVSVNDLATVRLHRSPYKRRNFTFAHLNEFELEPYGYGVGRVAEQTQPELNSNRGRMHDTITFSLFNMWLASRMANIKPGQLKVKPWGVVEVDGDIESALKPIRPQLEGVNFGLQMEQMMKTEFRGTTGASDNLQAIVTEASATEASIAQTEAVRRLSVIAENISEPLLREHVSKMHENNMTFLDQPFSIAATGRPDSIRVYPSDLALDVEVQTKIVTDKDFRPQRNKDLLQFLQVVTSIRNQNPQMGQVNLAPFVEEFARGVGMNPKNVWQSIPNFPGMTMPGQAPQQNAPTAMDRQVGQAQQGAASMRSQAGALGQDAHAGSQARMAEALA
jgi:hypothetical protein